MFELLGRLLLLIRIQRTVYLKSTLGKASLCVYILPMYVQ